MAASSARLRWTMCPRPTLFPAHGREAEAAGAPGGPLFFSPSFPIIRTMGSFFLPAPYHTGTAGKHSLISLMDTSGRSPGSPGWVRPVPVTIPWYPGTPTYREDLEEVDWREVGLLASLVRWKRHSNVFQVLREQNYEKSSPRRRENETINKGGAQLPTCPHIN